MFKCDYHTHSYFSFDGDSSSTPDALCKAAIAKGITDLAITDHFECNWNSDINGGYPPLDTVRAYNEIMIAKEKYADVLNVSVGLELGQANQYPDEAYSVLSRHSYDFVIGSIHNLTSMQDFCCFDFSKDFADEYIYELFEKNIDELCQVLDMHIGIDTLAHITYMQRYLALAGKSHDFTTHTDSLSRLFSKMISQNIALEVNVSTLWKGLGFAMPSYDILSIYRSCGGKLITVGTDAHSPQNVGDCVDVGFELIKSVGFDSVLVVRDCIKTSIKI